MGNANIKNKTERSLTMDGRTYTYTVLKVNTDVGYYYRPDRVWDSNNDPVYSDRVMERIQDKMDTLKVIDE